MKVEESCRSEEGSDVMWISSLCPSVSQRLPVGAVVLLSGLQSLSSGAAAQLPEQPAGPQTEVPHTVVHNFIWVISLQINQDKITATLGHLQCSHMKNSKIFQSSRSRVAVGMYFHLTASIY